MDMVSRQMLFPKDMIPYVESDDAQQIFRRNAMILYPYIQNTIISHGRAAEILGVHKFDLIDFYDSVGLPYLCQSADDLEAEMTDIRSLQGEITA